MLENKNELYKLSVEEKRLAEACREDFQGSKMTLGFFFEDNQELRENRKADLQAIAKQFTDLNVKLKDVKSMIVVYTRRQDQKRP